MDDGSDPIGPSARGSSPRSPAASRRRGGRAPDQRARGCLALLLGIGALTRGQPALVNFIAVYWLLGGLD